MFYTDDDLKVKDLKFEGKGLFFYINQIRPLPFINVLDTRVLDLGFEMKHGQKILSPFVKERFNQDVKETTMIELAEIIVSMFSNKWETLISIYETELDLKTYELTTVESVDETGNVSNLKEDVSSSERENQVSAFDTETLSNDGKEINTGTNTLSDTGNTSNLKNLTRTVSGSLSNKLDDIQKIKMILKNDVINDIIYIDIVQLVGLSIY